MLESKQATQMELNTPINDVKVTRTYKNNASLHKKRVSAKVTCISKYVFIHFLGFNIHYKTV
jgi:hypothetical protein